MGTLYPEAESYVKGKKVCTAMSINPCQVDVNKLWDTIVTLVAYDKLHPPIYNVGVTDCQWWAQKIFEDAVPKAKGCTVL